MHIGLELVGCIFAGFFESSPDVTVPLVHESLCTEKVLVMEFIDGIKISDRAGLVRAGLKPAEVMQIIASAYAEQIFRRGFFHADPHPGNLLVRRRKDDLGPEVVFLDFGLSKELPPHVSRWNHRLHHRDLQKRRRRDGGSTRRSRL